MNQSNDFIMIGQIVNTHGVKGEIKLKSQTDFKKDRYNKNNLTYIDYNGEKIDVKVKSFRTHKGFDLLIFEGLEDINLIEKYKGCYLYTENKKVKELSKNEYHISDLVGLNVFQNQDKKGIVQSIRSYPQGDYLEIMTINNEIKLVPFIKEFILDVNLITQSISVIEMEGLL